MMALRKILFVSLATLLLGGSIVVAEEADDYNDYDAQDDGNAAAANNDDAEQAYYYDNIYSNSDFSAGDDSITYWTDYAILPKRCIVYNNVDVIVFSVHEEYYKQCQDSPTGTYITPVPNFLKGYLQYYAQIQEDKGSDDYELPEVADYAYCTRVVIQNEERWLQIGCADDDQTSIAVNIYTDNTCQTRYKTENGYDDANIDISEIQLPFKRCQSCVMWVDKNDDEIDDMFYENRKMNAPLCSTAWNFKQKCDRKCLRTGVDHGRVGWNTPDKVLLAILAIFGFGMLVAILQKRQNMSNKDALLEQAAMTAAGLQQAHVIGIFFLIIVVITVFALLQLKNITWALLLIMNTGLFGYLMKLTVDSGVSAGEAVIGPDGTVIRHADSDDSSVESVGKEDNHNNAGTYMLPTLS